MLRMIVFWSTAQYFDAIVFQLLLFCVYEVDKRFLNKKSLSIAN